MFRHEFRDPLAVLLTKEAATCKGCSHSETITAFGQKHQTCNKRRKHGNRCKHYREAEK